MKFILLLVINFAVVIAHSQDKDPNFNHVADELIPADTDDDEGDLESRYENLTLLLSNPVDLNKVSADDLRQFYFLSENQIVQLIQYRKQQGEFLSVYELQAIPDFDQNTITLLSPLVKVVANEELINSSVVKRMFSKGNAYLITRWEKTLEEKSGFSDSLEQSQKYQGSDQKIFTRFRSTIPFDYSVGFTLEKDAGEKTQWNPRLRRFGADYNSAHVQLIDKGRLKNIILGDYQAQFAQGLVLGGSFGLGKSAETITTTRRTNIGFVPHSSAGESGFYRGAAASYDLAKRFRLSTFVSKIARDATVVENEGNTTVSAFQYAGFHRNENERNSEKNVGETVYGSVLHYRQERFDAGIIFQHIYFQYPVQKSVNAYNQFAFSGRENTNASLFFNYTVNNFCIFGEAVQSIGNGNAALVGILGSLTPALDISILYRNYQKNYYAFYANPFSENTQPQNETGIYWGMKYRWSRRWTLASYIDLFRFPWLGFRRYAPASGHEWLSRITFSPSRKVSLFAQVRQERKARNTSDETIQYNLDDGLKTNLWASMSYAEGILRIRTRVQYSTYRFNGKLSDGIVLLQGVGFEIGKFQLTGHYALFQTKDFDNRQYVYENDVYLVFTLPFYDGKGTRSMLMLQYGISKHLSLYLRYSRSYFSDKAQIGSGLESINGNMKNDVKFQTVFRF
jgi:hypothetical protein